MSSDMKKIINDSSRADVTLLLNGKPLHAHRCILMVRCKALDDKIKLLGRKSEERERNKWNIINDKHVVLEI